MAVWCEIIDCRKESEGIEKSSQEPRGSAMD